MSRIALLAGVLMISGLTVKSQETLSLSWPLTSPDRVKQTSSIAWTGFGTGTAVDKVIFDREYGAMAGGWNSPAVNPAAFYEYRVAPEQGTSLTFSELKVDISLGYGEMNTVVKYSTDRFQSPGRQIGQPVFFYTTNPQTLTLPANITVSYPDTLSIRIFAWGAGDHMVEFNNRNTMIKGAVTSSRVISRMDTLPSPKDTIPENRDPWLAPLADVTFSTPGNHSWICPADVTCVKVECWGGGGRGGTRSTNGAGGGGGGGAYSRSVLTVVPLASYTVFVGAGSTLNTNPGGDTYFNNTSTVLAKGGNTVAENSPAGAAGGLASTGVGDIKYNGGGGAAGSSSNYGGGGGSSAGTASDGATAINATGATAPAGGGSGGNGKTPPNGVGNAGSTPGGAGGGALRTPPASTTYNGGNGANGKVIITWDAIPSTSTPTVSAPICKSSTTVSGTSAANAAIIVYNNVMTQIGTTTANGSGNWTAPVSPLAAVLSVTATAKSADSCMSAHSAAVTVSPILSNVSIAPATAQTFCFSASGIELSASETGGYSITGRQWGKRSVSLGAITDIPGATSQTYTPTGTDLGAGTWYVVCTSTPVCGLAIVSNEVTVSVIANLSSVSITPNNAQSFCISAAGTQLTAAETGGGAITGRQWGKRSVPSGTITPISGATGNTYTPTGVDLGAGAWYIVCTSTPACGSATVSNEVTITVNANLSAVSITPVSAQTFCNSGSGNLLTAAETGGGVITGRQWGKRSVSSGAITPIGGAIGSTYTPTSADLGIGDWYVVCTSTPVCGSATISNEVTVAVNDNPIVTASSNSPICFNTTLNLFANASGGTPGYSFSWTGPSGFLSALQNPSILNATTVNAGIYDVVVTDANGCSATSSVTVIVRNIFIAPVVTASQTICNNNVPAPLNATEASGGTGPYSYQWQSSPNLSTWTDIPLATGLFYPPPALTADTYYRILTTDTGTPSCATLVQSNVILITVNNITSAGIIVSNQVLCTGESPVPFISILPGSGDGAITYQWQSSEIAFVGPFTNIPGATGLNYAPPPVPLVTTWYRRMTISTLNGVSCTAPSNVLKVTVATFDPGTISTTNTVYCSGQNPVPIIGTVWSPPPDPNILFQGYQWQSSTIGPAGPFNNITGATLKDYDPPVIAQSTWYRRVISITIQSKSCSASSNVIGLLVYPQPTISVNTPLSVCEGNVYTIIATAGNTANPSFTLTYVSGTYITPPAIQTNNTGIFIVPLPVTPEAPPVGQQHFTVTVTNGDDGGCSASAEVIVEIWDVPHFTLTTSCAGLDGTGTIFVSGSVTYPPGVIQYRIMQNPSGPWSSWFNGPTYLFTGLLLNNSYTVQARNPAHPECTLSLSGTILDKSVETLDYSLCQTITVPSGEGLIGISLGCVTWGSGGNTSPNKCTNDPLKLYNVSASNTPPYSGGPLVRYERYGFIKPAVNETSIFFKACPGDPCRSMSLYEFPFDPSNPSLHFVAKIDDADLCPNGFTVNGLSSDVVYEIIINSCNTTHIACINFEFTGNPKPQIATNMSDVSWYDDPISGTLIATLPSGTAFNPMNYPLSGVTVNSCPGTYTFYAGCETSVCREPAFFVIYPIPIVVAENQTICSGSTTEIWLSSIDNCNQPVNPAEVTYEWTASEFIPSASGFSDCSSDCGSVIAQTITSNDPSVCPVVRYMVRATIGGCSGEWYPVDVLVINENSIVPPVPPPDITVLCIDDVPPTETLTAEHACLGTLSATGIDSNNGGTGCPSDPLIITRTWTFSDACVNIVITQTITVVDDQPATFTVPPDIPIYTNNSCDYSIDPFYTGDVTDEADNCPFSGLFQATWTDVSTTTCQGSLVVNRTWSLTDDCGNTNTQVQIITVLDIIPPEITFCPVDSTVIVNSGNVYIHWYNSWNAAATDNCSSPTVTAMLTGATTSGPHTTLNGVAFNAGTTTVTWTAKDDCGNTNSIVCSFEVVVLGQADIAVEKTGAPEPITPGQTITYTITITNYGPAIAPEITLSDLVPVEILNPEFSANGGVTWNDWTGSWITYNLASGENTIILIRGEVDCVITGLSNTAEVELGTLTDPDLSNNTSSWNSIINDPPPTFTAPADMGFCVNNIITANWDLQPEPLTDIVPVRPDWYIINGTPELNISDIADNCCTANQCIIHWTITFNDTPPHPPISGTGQPSAYGLIMLWGNTDYTECTHTITYVVEDCNSNPSDPVIVNITIKPRPNVIKVY